MRATFTLALTAVLAGCANTINLIDPAGPRFEGRFAPVVAPAAGGDRGALRVVTFNVRYGRAVDSTIALLRDAPELRGADLVALQEVDDSGVERIARGLGLNYVYFPSSIHPTEDRHWGSALLTPWPIDSAWKLLLPHEDVIRRGRHSATAGRVLVRGRPIRVYAVHFEVAFRMSRARREDQADAVIDDAQHAAEPVVVAGDFNDWGLGDYMADAGFDWPTRDAPSSLLVFHLDHVLSRGFTTREVGVVEDTRDASDHKPVWVVLEPSAVRYQPSAKGTR